MKKKILWVYIHLLTTGQLISFLGNKLNVIQTWDKGYFRVCLYQAWGKSAFKNKNLKKALLEGCKSTL